MAENINFVTIELSRKQVNTDNPVHNEKTGKDYARVFAPGNGTFLYPLGSIKVKSDNPDRVYFSRPEGTEIQVQYGRKKANVPDSAPNSEKYENFTKTWKIEELKVAYDEEKRAYVENHGFVNYTVPTSWGKPFYSGEKEYVSISVPVPVEGMATEPWCSFILPEDRFKSSEKQEGMSYFGFPKKKKDSTEDYMVNLKYSELAADGQYINKEIFVSSSQLKEYVDKAVSRSEVKDLFVSTTVSGKLVRGFESKEGKSLYAISIPIYENGADKATFYEIVVPQERLRRISDSNQVRLSLFKQTPDGEDYTFSARRSFENGNGGYDTVTKTLTSVEVVSNLEKSREKYREAHSSNNDASLADIVSGQADQENDQSQNGFRRHSGR